MRFTRSGCVDCGLPCLGSSCPNNKVEDIYCDKCKMEMCHDKVYSTDDYEDICENCIEEVLLESGEITQEDIDNDNAFDIIQEHRKRY